MKVNKKKAIVLFALTLMITSLLLINMNGPTTAQPSTNLHLHGPPLQPIHMHSNITLNPIHMHHTKGILWPGVPPITEPNCTTDWIRIEPEVDPIDFELWHLTSWEDWGEPFEELSQNDQIDMNNTETGEIEWFHVDRMTLTLNLSGPYPFPYHEPGPTAMLLELKQPYCSPYDPYIVDSTNQPNFSFTLWHQVWPIYSPVYQITNWMDDPSNPNGVLDFTDSISFDFGFNWYHVEDVATDLILRWKMMDPIGTGWHELYPDYCENYTITSWSSFPDPWCDRISPKDTIDMFRLSDQTTHWYFVDRVTITINVTAMEPAPFPWMMLELKTHYFEEMYHWIKKPINSTWHSVHPVYSSVFNLSWWDPMDPLWDNCNGVLDPCDHILLKNITDPFAQEPDMPYHITDMSYDIILNEYITDPVCTDWHELHPNCTQNVYHLQAWENNTMDVWLSPCDNVTLSDPAGFPADYHVENVTLTLNVTILDIAGQGPFETIGETIYLEHVQDAWNYSWPRLYHPKIEPLDTNWTVVCPTDYFGEELWIWYWLDNCNGVLSYSDELVLLTPTQQLFVHVDEVAVDMVVQKIGEEPPPPPPTLYWKPSYPDYAPSGVPDFDQNQAQWSPRYCAPTAAGNSLFWLDSRFHPSNLLTVYPGAVSEHDPSNVQPFIEHLAWLMDTDGQRTGLVHSGTWTVDMETGIAQYLSWSGVNPLGDVNGDGTTDMTDWHLVNAVKNGSMPFDIYADIYPETVTGPYTADNLVNQSDLDLVSNNMGTTGQFHEWTILHAPPFHDVAEQVMACEDVILILGFWYYDDGWFRYSLPYEEGSGHAVTVAGINSTSVPPLIAISDPDNDAFESGLTPGRSPVPHAFPHGNTTHNNASLVSHDIYNVTFGGWPSGTWALQGYVGAPQGMVAVVESAVITSPLAAPDVGATNVVACVDYCLPCPTNEAYPDWTVNVTVTVENFGTTSATFTVSAYYNDTLIGTQPVNNLPAGQDTNKTFSWNLASVPLGLYTLKANVTLGGDTNPGNDEFVNGAFLVKLDGDVNGNRVVESGDLIFGLAPAIGSFPGDLNWNCQADFNFSGSVESGDLIFGFAPNNGSSY